MPDTNFIQEFIGMIYNWAQPLFSAFLPWAGVLIGLSLVFIFGRGLIDSFFGFFENLFHKKNNYENSLKEIEKKLDNK